VELLISNHLSIILLALSVVFSGLILISFNVWLFSATTKMTDKEKVAITKRLLINLLPVGITLVTQAEAQWTLKTGGLKEAWVISELYKHIPDEYKAFVTEDNLKEVCDSALKIARIYWESRNVKSLKIDR
jgi:hypothetical protein